MNANKPLLQKGDYPRIAETLHDSGVVLSVNLEMKKDLKVVILTPKTI